MSQHHYAIFSARYAPEVGGVESYTKNMAHQLVTDGDRATVVTLALSDAPSHEVQEDGVEVVRLPGIGLMGGRLPLARKGREYRRTMAEAALTDVDRVLVNTRFYGHSVDGLRFARSVGASAVMLDHGSAYLTLGGGLSDVVIRRYEHFMTAIDKRFHPTFAGVSSASAAWLKTYGIQTDFVIPNAIDAPAFRAEASGRDFRSELGVGDDQLLVVSVGRLSPEKGSRELLEAARLVGDSVVVAIAGDGMLRAELEATISPNAHLLGNLDHPNLSALLSQADLFCLPTRSEGFCTSLLEAGAWGLTPLMTHVGGTDEVMGNPPTYGRILAGMDASVVADALRSMRDAGEMGRSPALQAYVDSSCTWQASAEALRHAFGD